jgi:flagellar export protein FliJ
MAQFRFALDKILRWRALELAAEEAKLERLLQEKIKIDAMIDRVNKERSGLPGSISALSGLQGSDFRAMAAYGIRLRQHVEKLKEAVARIEKGIVAQRKKFADAKLRLRLLEQLKERRMERWQYEEARRMETVAAESYLAGWNRSEE